MVEITAVGDDTALTVHSFSLLPCYICYVRNTININYTTKILMQYAHTIYVEKKRKEKKNFQLFRGKYTRFTSGSYIERVPAPTSIFFTLPPQLFSFFLPFSASKLQLLLCLHI